MRIKLLIQPGTNHSPTPISRSMDARKLQTRDCLRRQSFAAQRTSHGIRTMVNCGLNVETARKIPASRRCCDVSRSTDNARNAAAIRLKFCNRTPCRTGKLPIANKAKVSSSRGEMRGRKDRVHMASDATVRNIDKKKKLVCTAEKDRRTVGHSKKAA